MKYFLAYESVAVLRTTEVVVTRHNTFIKTEGKITESNIKSFERDTTKDLSVCVPGGSIRVTVICIHSVAEDE